MQPEAEMTPARITLPSIALAVTALVAISCAREEKPPVVRVRSYEWADLQLDQVKAGDWVEYRSARNAGEPARRRRFALLKVEADAYWIEASPDEPVPEGWVLLARLSNPGRSLQACWIGRPGGRSYVVAIEPRVELSPQEIEARDKQMRDITQYAGLPKVKGRAGEVGRENVRVGSRDLPCEKTIVKTTWDSGLDPNRVVTETSCWSTAVPRFLPRDTRWFGHEVVWLDVRPKLEGGLVRHVRESSRVEASEELVDFGHDAKPTIEVPELK